MMILDMWTSAQYDRNVGQIAANGTLYSVEHVCSVDGLPYDQAVVVRTRQREGLAGSFKTVRLGITLDDLGMFACKRHEKNVSALHAQQIEGGYDIQTEAQRVTDSVAKIRFRNDETVVEEWGGVSLAAREVGFQFLKSEGGTERVWQLALWLADTLIALRDSGIIHLDIKPSNILYDPATGVFRLTDFDVAKRTQEGVARANDTDGTISFISPEVLGARIVDERADAYSVGATLFRMYYGRLWRSPDRARAVGQVLEMGALDDAARRKVGLARFGLEVEADEGGESVLSSLEEAILGLLDYDRDQRLSLEELRDRAAEYLGSPV